MLYGETVVNACGKFKGEAQRIDPDCAAKERLLERGDPRDLYSWRPNGACHDHVPSLI